MCGNQECYFLNIAHPTSKSTEARVLHLFDHATHIESMHWVGLSLGCKGTPRIASALAKSSPGVNQGSKFATSAAVNIPSPPLTPFLSYDDEDIDVLEPRDQDYPGNIFSSRYHKVESIHQQHDPTLIQRHSTSAPSMISSLQQIPSAANAPSPFLGFTFSSNISMNQPSENRDSYASIQTTMEQDGWKSVSTIRSTYFFDGIGRGGGFLAVSVTNDGSPRHCSMLKSIWGV